MKVVPIAPRVRVRITAKGARFLQLLHQGYFEEEAMAIVAAEYELKLVEAPDAAIPRPHSPRGDE